ncbi:hypothetical protein ABZ907_45570 [Nonomuraea wenchangensis]
MGLQAPANAADQVKPADIQQAIDNVARTDGVVDVIGEMDLIRHTSGIPDSGEAGKFDVFDFTTAYKPIDLVKAARALPQGEGRPLRGLVWPLAVLSAVAVAATVSAVVPLVVSAVLAQVLREPLVSWRLS